MNPPRPQPVTPSGADARYRLLFERTPQPMWVYDVETLRFLAVNDAAVGHYGYSREEFLAMTVADLRCEEGTRGDQNLVSLESRRSAAESRHVKKAGTVIDVELLSDDLPFAEHRGKLVVATDVTERKRTRAELEQRAAKQAVVAR